MGHSNQVLCTFQGMTVLSVVLHAVKDVKYLVTFFSDEPFHQTSQGSKKLAYVMFTATYGAVLVVSPHRQTIGVFPWSKFVAMTSSNNRFKIRRGDRAEKKTPKHDEEHLVAWSGPPGHESRRMEKIWRDEIKRRRLRGEVFCPGDEFRWSSVGCMRTAV